MNSHILGPARPFWHLVEFSRPVLKFISILPSSNKYPPACSHSIGCCAPSRLQSLPGTHISSTSALPYGLRGPSGELRPHFGELCCSTLNIDHGTGQGTSCRAEHPRIWVCKVLKRAVVTGWRATFPRRVLCFWEAAIPVFQRLSYNWTMHEDV